MDWFEKDELEGLQRDIEKTGLEVRHNEIDRLFDMARKAIENKNEAEKYKARAAEQFGHVTELLRKNGDLKALVEDAGLQIEYLHEKLGSSTGSGNAVLAKIREALK